MNRSTLIAVIAIMLFPTQSLYASTGDASQRFFSNVTKLCGKVFHGRFTQYDEADREMAQLPVAMEIEECDGNEIKIPVKVGNDQSRTWLLIRSGKTLRLLHDHRASNGTADRALYGAEAVEGRDEFRQVFRASKDHEWILSLVPGSKFAYELKSPDRNLLIEFEL